MDDERTQGKKGAGSKSEATRSEAVPEGQTRKERGQKGAQPQTRPRPGDPHDVREILVDIAAEGELARIDGRVEEIATDLARLTADLQRSDSARRADFEVMRVRVEDALRHVSETTEDQRGAWSELDQRIARMADELTAGLRRTTEGLRAELLEAAARSAAAIEAAEARRRSEAEAGKLDAKRDHGELSERLDALRRELEGRTGEIRAAHRLAVSKLDETVAEVSSDLRSRLEGLEAELAAERDRWAEALAGTGTAIRDAATSLREALERERAARGRADRGLAERLDAVEGRLERLDGRVAALAGRQESDVNRVERLVVEGTERVAATERRLRAERDTEIGELRATIVELSGRLERAESLTQEIGRVIVSATGRKTDLSDPAGDPVEVRRDGSP
jgi:hypothetical protein